MVGLLEKTLFNTLFFDLVPEEKHRSGKTFGQSSRHAKVMAIFLSILSTIERTVLLPLQIVGKPFFAVACFVSKNQKLHQFYHKFFPKSLIKASLKIPAGYVSLVIVTAMNPWTPLDCYEMHHEMGLVSKPIPSVISKCYWHKNNVKVGQYRVKAHSKKLVEAILRNAPERELRELRNEENRAKQFLAEDESAYQLLKAQIIRFIQSNQSAPVEDPKR